MRTARTVFKTLARLAAPSVMGAVMLGCAHGADAVLYTDQPPLRTELRPPKPAPGYRWIPGRWRRRLGRRGWKWRRGRWRRHRHR